MSLWGAHVPVGGGRTPSIPLKPFEIPFKEAPTPRGQGAAPVLGTQTLGPHPLGLGCKPRAGSQLKLLGAGVHPYANHTQGTVPPGPLVPHPERAKDDFSRQGPLRPPALPATLPSLHLGLQNHQPGSTAIPP